MLISFSVVSVFLPFVFDHALASTCLADFLALPTDFDCSGLFLASLGLIPSLAWGAFPGVFVTGFLLLAPELTSLSARCLLPRTVYLPSDCRAYADSVSCVVADTAP